MTAEGEDPFADYLDGDEDEEPVEEASAPPDPLTGVVGLFLAEREPWVKKANCRGSDPNLFILERGAPPAKAKRICAECTVGEECEEYAIRTRSVGIFNGKTFGLKSRKKMSIDIQDGKPRRV